MGEKVICTIIAVATVAIVLFAVPTLARTWCFNTYYTSLVCDKCGCKFNEGTICDGCGANMEDHGMLAVESEDGTQYFYKEDVNSTLVTKLVWR